MKKVIKALPLFASLFLINNAAAQENQSGFFTSVALGITEHTVDVSGAGANYEEESGRTSSSGISVGYNINDSWSVIAQYNNFGEADLFDADIDTLNVEFSTETTGFSVVGQWMSPREVKRWSLGARLGLIKWDTDFNMKFSDGMDSETYTESDSGVAIYGGLGCAYAMSTNWDLTIDMDWFVNDLDVELIEDAATDMQYSKLSLGLKYYW